MVRGSFNDLMGPNPNRTKIKPQKMIGDSQKIFQPKKHPFSKETKPKILKFFHITQWGPFPNQFSPLKTGSGGEIAAGRGRRRSRRRGGMGIRPTTRRGMAVILVAPIATNRRRPITSHIKFIKGKGFDATSLPRTAHHQPLPRQGRGTFALHQTGKQQATTKGQAQARSWGYKFSATIFFLFFFFMFDRNVFMEKTLNFI